MPPEPAYLDEIANVPFVMMLQGQERLAGLGGYDLGPSQEAVTCVQPTGGQREIRRMRWGLMPTWTTDPAISDQLISARAERVARKPVFRGALAGAGVPAPAGFDPAAAEGLSKIPRIIKVPMT